MQLRKPARGQLQTATQSLLSRLQAAPSHAAETMQCRHNAPILAHLEAMEACCKSLLLCYL